MKQPEVTKDQCNNLPISQFTPDSEIEQCASVTATVDGDHPGSRPQKGTENRPSTFPTVKAIR